MYADHLLHHLAGSLHHLYCWSCVCQPGTRAVNRHNSISDAYLFLSLPRGYGGSLSLFYLISLYNPWGLGYKPFIYSFVIVYHLIEYR